MSTSPKMITKEIQKQLENKQFINPKTASMIIEGLDIYEEYQKNGIVYYKMKGNNIDLKCVINYIFKCHHPAGYMTEITRAENAGPSKLYGEMHRYSSSW